MRRTLVDLLQRAIDRDPRDAPTVSVKDACDLQDLSWFPETSEPVDVAHDASERAGVGTGTAEGVPAG